MCTFVAAAVALAGVSTGLQVMGQINQGKTAAQMAKLEAQQQQQAGKVEAARIRDGAQRLLGTQNAIIGASGFTAGGSNLDILLDSAAQAELDARTAEINGANAASATRLSGQYAKYNSKWAALGSAVNGGTNMMMMAGSWGGGAPNTTTAASTSWTSTGRVAGPV